MHSRRARLGPTLCGAVASALVLAACGSGTTAGQPDLPTPTATVTAPQADQEPSEPATDASPTMSEDGIVTVALAEPYTPSSQTAASDDYRCFLIDTQLAEDRFVTGVRFSPGNPDVVHHAILYRVDPSQVKAAEKRDSEAEGQGWPCFGGPDLPAPTSSEDPISRVESTPWLAAWAPGGRESRFPDGTGVPLAAESRVVLQVHYNLLAGTGPDATEVYLRTEPGDAGLTPLETFLLPAPVELPCGPDESGPLCDREAAVTDTIERFGGESLRTIWGLQLICGGDLVEPQAGPTQSCEHQARQDMTIYAAAGHMHLLGRTLTIEHIPADGRPEMVLDIPLWDFDQQGATRLPEPLSVAAGDRLKVTCTHDVGLRQQLPALADTEPRYITWGEGTTDEMCLGILTVSRTA